MAKKFNKRHLLDYSILIPYLILCVIGLMMVYSSTSYKLLAVGTNPMKSFNLQVIFWVISLILISVIYKMKTPLLRNQFLSQVALSIVLIGIIIARFMQPVNGAYGWIPLFGGSTIQPVEFFKFIIIWYLSAFFTSHSELSLTDSLKHYWKAPALIGLGIGIVTLYPDLGNAAQLTLIVLIMLLLSGVNYLYTAVYGGLATVFSIVTIWIIKITGGKFLPAHVGGRFEMFRDPFADEFNLGHQMVNGYYAMFNGGLLGRGLGNSIQKKGFLKEAHTDYIFAVVVEELGLLGAIAIMGLLFYMIARIILVGIRSKDAFNSMMCLGIGALFILQIFINLGGIMGLIPLTGITFPFLSQGGSSLMILSIAVGFALNISADEKRKQYQLY